HQIVSFSPKSASFDGRILDEVERLPFRVDGVHFEIARQLKQQRSFSSAANVNLGLRRCTQGCRRLHCGLDLKVRDRDVTGERRSCTGRSTGGKRCPDIEEEEVIL